MTSSAPPVEAPSARRLPVRPTVEQVVLLDARGRAVGVRDKAAAHGPHTALHLAFSCHVVAPDGRVLLTQRSVEKRTWPGVWTNACCGHPSPGESVGQAALRRLREELGAAPSALTVALPDFLYRAQMADGTVEHELCPVLVARVDGPIDPDPCEVGALEWVDEEELRERVGRTPGSLSPWSVAQMGTLLAGGRSLASWLHRSPPLRRRLLAWTPGRSAVPAPSEGGGDAMAPVRGPVEALLVDVTTSRAAALATVDPALTEVASEIGGLVGAGGKRLRPAFVYWGHRAAGGEHDPEVLVPAAAVELLHTFALLHDDVMDRSVTRRGRPAAHAALAARHRQAGHAGSSEWFGTSAAILAGDLTFVWADEVFESARLPAAALAAGRRVFTDLRAEVVAGQYLDLRLAASSGRASGSGPVRPGEEADGERAAEAVALLKSARYTVTRPLLLGAALAGPTSPEVEQALQAYGDAVGFAFQMRDDVLGLFGRPGDTGKGVLEDLREGKRTLLVQRALRLATPAQRQVLLAHLGDPGVGEEEAARVREVVAASGALASVEARIAADHATALAALGRLPQPAAAALEELAALAIERGA